MAFLKMASISRKYLHRKFEKSHSGGINDTAQLDSAVFRTADDTTAPPIAACGTENCCTGAEICLGLESL